MKRLGHFIKKFYIYFLIAIIYIPLIVVVVWSFSSPSPKGNIQNSFEWNGFLNYIELFQNNEFLNGLVNTLIIGFIATPIAVFIATITCYGIWNSNKLMRKAVMFNSNVSIINPEIITGISLTLLFSTTWISLGINLGLFTVILSHISFCTPYAIISIYPRMCKLNKNLINASNDLGYGPVKTFFNVVVPFLLPSIIGACALVFAMSFDDFIITNLVRGRVTTISSEMYLMAKGIKMWAVTFGSLLIIVFILFLVIKSITLYVKDKKKDNKIYSNVFFKISNENISLKKRKVVNEKN